MGINERIEKVVSDFLRDRKLSNIGTMKMIDALIEMGYYIHYGNKTLDRELHTDIAAFRVDAENIMCWKNGNPRPTAIDAKYVNNGPAVTEKLFFEIDHKKEQYLTRRGWGMYLFDYYFNPENMPALYENYLRGNAVCINIAYVQQHNATDNEIMKATDIEELVDRYKSTRAPKQPIIMTPLYYMQGYFLSNIDARAYENYYSKLYRTGNGLLMPLWDYKKKYAYEKYTWNETAAKWDIIQHGQTKMPENKPISGEGERRGLQELYDQQLHEMRNGTLDYKHLLDIQHLKDDMDKEKRKLEAITNEFIRIVMPFTGETYEEISVKMRAIEERAKREQGMIY